METEIALLRRFAGTRDAEAFREIVRRHAGVVYGAALRILSDVDRASDVAQETFLQLTKDAGTVTGSLPGWLHRVATHKAIDATRRDASRRRTESQYVASKPREITAWKDLSASIDEGLNALDAEMREILVAHFLEGRTTRQMASMMGISQATVSRRIEAGVTALRRILQTRGLLVAVGALGTLLTENAVEATPQVLMSELGKMALAGTPAAAASAGGSGLAETAGGTLLAGAKAKAVAAVAIAAIGVGSVVTYHEVTRPTPSETIAQTQPAPEASRPTPGPAVPAARNRASTEALPDDSSWWSQTTAEMGDGADEGKTPAISQAKSDQTVAQTPRTQASRAGGPGAGFTLASDPSAEPKEEQVEQTSGGMMGGGSYYYRYGPGKDSNDANSSSSGGSYYY